MHRTPTRRLVAPALLTLLAVAPLAACGADSTASSSSAAPTSFATSSTWNTIDVPTRTAPASVNGDVADAPLPVATSTDPVTSRDDLTKLMPQPWQLSKRTATEAIVDLTTGDPACWGVHTKAEKVGGEVRVTVESGLLPGKESYDCKTTMYSTKARVTLPEGSSGLPLVPADGPTSTAPTHAAG